MQQISRICPVTDEQAARMVSADTLTELARQVTATPAEPLATRRRRGPSRRRMLFGAPLGAAVAAAAAFVLVSGVTSGGPPSKPLPAAAAKALAFTVKNGYITVIVKDPYADPSWYNADFKRHHLNVTLRMLPASPSIVGTIIFTDVYPSDAEKQITTITAKGCQEPSGGACPVGIKLPLNFRGQYQVYFGRAARPGEQYVSTGSAFASGEALHGMRYIVGQSLPTVLAELRSRHLSAVLHMPNGRGLEQPGRSPGPWYVWGANPFAPGKVMLWVGHSRPASANPDPNAAS